MIPSRLIFSLLFVAALLGEVEAFLAPNTPQAKLIVPCSRTTNVGFLYSCRNNRLADHQEIVTLQPASSLSKKTTPQKSTTSKTKNFLASVALVTALSLAPLPYSSNTAAYAYSDYASETVQNAVESLRKAAGDAEETFQVYEGIAEIIAEGKGVGGSVDYKGVTLDRGYIADEDTSIYNPGLTLLTEGEKERLVESLIQSRKVSIEKDQWNEKNQSAYAYLKFQLDPLHMTELRGYLQVAPILVGILYLGVLAVQQFARELFPVAYIAAVLALVAPAAVLVLTAQ